MAEENQTKRENNQIFIVEDDFFLRDVISRKLESAGYSISVAKDGETALDEIKNFKPNLILLDLVLPKMDGFKVLEQLKEDESTKEIPVIILSNLGQKDEIDKGMELGAEDFMIKAHFTPSEIVEKVTEKIEKNEG